MTAEQLKLIESMLQRHSEILNVLDGIVEAEILIVQAMVPQVLVTLEDGGPVTMQ